MCFLNMIWVQMTSTPGAPDNVAEAMDLEPNLTYDDIAAPWQNYSFQFLGERIDETSENWLNVLLANDQNTAVQELTAYGLNNNIEKVIDTMTDNIASSVGVSESGVQRGFST